MSDKTQRVSIVLPLWAYQHMLDHAAAAGVAVSEFIAQAAISFVVPDAEAETATERQQREELQAENAALVAELDAARAGRKRK